MLESVSAIRKYGTRFRLEREAAVIAFVQKHTIAGNLDSGSDISALIRTCRALHNSIVSDYLYEHDVKHGSYGLAKAAFNNDTKVAQRLLDKGADVNTTAGYGPLYYAVEQGHEEMVRLLLDNGADINQIVIGKSVRFTLVCVVADNGNTTLLRMLLEHAGDGWIRHLGSALQRASWRGHEHTCRLLLDKYVRYTFPDPDYNPKYDLDVAIFSAQSRRHEKIARMLRDVIGAHSS